uniref:Dehydrin COR410 n=1 Tax=Aegilops tauschii subsp. strangulata TaxID=200361 RepID=A0A453P943_AEGTS
MEDERSTQSYQGGEAAEQVEVTDRGLLGNLLGKKKAEEDKEKEEELVTGMEKVSVEEPEVKKEEHEDEEEVIDDNGEVIKRKKKKGLKEKLQGKLPGHKDTEGEHVTGLPAPAAPASVQTHGGHHDTDVVVEKIDGDVKTEAAPAVPEEEKKGFLEKIKEKLPGGHKKPEDAAAVPVTHAAPAPVHAPAPAPEEVSSPDAKEKKGLLGKIMDKLPGYHKTGEEDKAAAATGEHKPSA